MYMMQKSCVISLLVPFILESVIFVPIYMLPNEWENFMQCKHSDYKTPGIYICIYAVKVHTILESYV